MGFARDLIDQANALVQQRSTLESTWENIAKLLFVHPDRKFRRGNVSSDRDALEGWATGSKTSERARFIYDTTGIMALERLATGLISLITPDNEKWQGLKIDDPFGYEMSDEETIWGERQRDYLLNVRYDPRSGWALANQAAIRSAAAIGTGAYIIEESMGKNGASATQVPWMCTNLPLSDNYLTINGQGFHDQNYRYFSLSYRAAAQMFDGKLSPKAMAMANDPVNCLKQITMLHYVGERQETGPLSSPDRKSPVTSCYTEIDTEHEVRHGGFGYWPVIVYNWNQMTNSPYGESATMLVMAEVMAANVLAKNSLLSAQQHTRPPIATMDDSSMNRPNLNPGAINFGGLDAQGNLKIKPITTGANPQLSQLVLDASRTQIKEGLYSNLWQILIQNPNMTATEAMIRANEKGELLGPIGTRIQHGLARLTDAELAILVSKGAWGKQSPLAPPPSMQLRNVSTRFSSPLDRLRRSGEMVGIQQTLGVAASLAQADPTVMDELDTEAIISITREITGAPAKIKRTKDAVAAIRDKRAQGEQMQQAQQMADIAKTGAQAAQAGVSAMGPVGDILAQSGIGA
jgi:Bacteriophage head to tail connecting protein